MKPLLFALLFVGFYGCGVSMKEVRREIEMNNFDNFIDNMKKDDRIIDWIAKVEKKSDPKTIVRLWDEYVSNCKSDTSRKIVNVWIDANGREYTTAVGDYDEIDLGFLQNYRGQREIIVYRSPTFEGFIEYLRNKR